LQTRENYGIGNVVMVTFDIRFEGQSLCLLMEKEISEFEGL